MSLDEHRKRIDEIDAEVVRALNERAGHVMEIGKLKKVADAEVYVPVREKQVFEKVCGLNEGPMPDEALRAIYREIMSASISLERDVRVAYYGPESTFTHQAARSRFGSSVNYLPCLEIGDVFAAVQKRSADYGVVPIENSTEGQVNPTLDELTKTSLKIYAEICLPIRHHLMSSGPWEDVVRVYSHPQILGQCRHWLAENLPKAELIPAASSARSASLASGEAGSAAIASELAAELNQLQILRDNIQDEAGNMTRFLVLSRSIGQQTGHDKTSVVFKIGHKSGALYDALSPFHLAQLNMTKIESRPSRLKAWEYWFFVDFEGHIDEDRVKTALEELNGHCELLTVLGSYPMAPRVVE
jgi:chorismate mutase/prephenate dehydratase